MTLNGDDADLDDLIDPSDGNVGTRKLLSSSNTLEIESPEDTYSFSPPPYYASSTPTFLGGRVAALCALVAFIVSSRPCATLGCMSLALVFFIVATVLSVQHEISPLIAAQIETDYSSINSQYDFSLGKIDHWCIFGGDEGCECNDPLDPISKAEIPGWLKTHKMNMGLIDKALKTDTEVDVAFVGDSITEEWNGRLFGRDDENLKGISNVFNEYFTKEGGGSYEGVALGIAGDQAPHLLWRLKHGEMTFNPKVWWILIGINDLVSGGCSPEVVLLGILRIVEEIQYNKPDATIVINGILPTAFPAVKVDKNKMKANAKMLKDKMKKNKKAGTEDQDMESPGEETPPKKGKFLQPITEVKDLGPTIKIINKQLKKFSDKHDNVQYFDAEDIFMTVNEKGKPVIDMELLNGLHPTKKGHALWAKKIVKKLGDWLVVEDNNSPPEPLVVESNSSQSFSAMATLGEMADDDGDEE